MLLGLISDRGRHVVGFLEAHPLLDGAAQLEEALAQLVGGQLVDGPQPAVAQVVDVVDVDPRVVALAQPQDVADGVDVILRDRGSSGLRGPSWLNLRLIRKRPTLPSR